MASDLDTIQATRGAPPDRPRSVSAPSRNEQLRDARQELDQATARLRRAGRDRNFAQNAARLLQAERDGKLPEDAIKKLDSADLGAALRDEVDAWAIGQAGISGDPKPPPPAAVLLYLLEKNEPGFRKFLATRISQLASDPNCQAFGSRNRDKLDAELVKASERVAEADAEVREATQAADIAGAKFRAINQGRLT